MGIFNLNWFQEKEVADLVPEFPRIFDQAVTDWAKYKLAVGQSIVPNNKREEVEEWFAEFPRLWETIRPNWVDPLPGGMYSARKSAFADKVDNWVATLVADPSYGSSGLGLATIIIAGIFIAGALGVGGAVWAVGYVKKQNNVSRIIDEVTAGRIPPAILQEAIKEERGGFFSDVSNISKNILLIGALGVGAYIFIPMFGKGGR